MSHGPGSTEPGIGAESNRTRVRFGLGSPNRICRIEPNRIYKPQKFDSPNRTEPQKFGSVRFGSSVIWSNLGHGSVRLRSVLSRIREILIPLSRIRMSYVSERFVQVCGKILSPNLNLSWAKILPRTSTKPEFRLKLNTQLNHSNKSWSSCNSFSKL